MNTKKGFGQGWQGLTRMSLATDYTNCTDKYKERIWPRITRMSLATDCTDYTEKYRRILMEFAQKKLFNLCHLWLCIFQNKLP
jgi:hypothetical protein